MTEIIDNKDTKLFTTIYPNSKAFVISRYPTATVWTIENCGHIPWLHNPKKYNEILADHFRL